MIEPRQLLGTSGDIWRMMQPFEQHHYREFQAHGRLPMWNPHILAGHPFHANGQSAMFHPLHWSNAWVEPVLTRGIRLPVRTGLSMLALYFLVRRFAVARLPAAVAALTWIFSAYQVRWLLWTSLSHATLSMPMLILSLDLLLTRISVPRFVLTCLLAGWLQLSGHPESQFLVGVTAGIFTVGRCLPMVSSAPGNMIVHLCIALLAMVVGTLLAAVALLPFLLNLAQSIDLSENLHALDFPFDGRSLLTLFSSEYYGRPKQFLGYRGPANYNLLAGWIGSLAWQLLACSFWVKQSPGRSSVYHTMLVLFGMGILQGTCGALFRPVMASIPLIGHTNQFYWFGMSSFAGSILVGMWLQAWMDKTATGAEELAQRNRRAITAVLALLAVGRLLIFFDRHWSALGRVTDEQRALGIWHHRATIDLIQTLAWVVIASLLTLRLYSRADREFAVNTMDRKRQPSAVKRNWLLIGVMVVSVMELLATAWDFQPSLPIKNAKQDFPSRLATIGSDPMHRMVAVHDLVFPNLGMQWGLQDVRGYDWPIPERWAKVLRHLDLHVGHPTYSAEQISSTGRHWNFLRNMCTRWVYGLRVGNHHSAKRVATGRDDDYLWEVKQPLPRLFIPKKVNAIQKEQSQQAFDHLISDVDPRELSLIEVPMGSEPSREPSPQGAARCKITTERADEVLIEVDSASEVVVVLHDKIAPGWAVEIDGKPAEALTANYLFRACRVKAGAKQVRWHYQPPGYQTGLATSKLVLCLLAGLLVIDALVRCVVRMKAGRS